MIDVFSIPKCQRKLENCGEQKFDKICKMCREKCKIILNYGVCLFDSFINFVGIRNRNLYTNARLADKLVMNRISEF